MKKYALISIYNKKNLSLICKVFKNYDIKILATGGTYKTICELGYKPIMLSKIINFNEILNGRVKTLHPLIHGGILFNRKKRNDLINVKQKNIPFIDFVVVNLYPFGEIVKKNKSQNICIENIDIGGHTLIRSAAKNYKYVTIISNQKDYKKLNENMIKNNGSTSLRFRKELARKAFKYILDYDLKISKWFGNSNNLFIENLEKQKLKYGENPHQEAFFYFKKNQKSFNYTQIHGKQLSFNNISDINSALLCIKEFKNKPCSIVIKHTNPCCAAIGKNIYDSFNKALSCDKKSAYGGILIINKKINYNIAKQINRFFFEIVIAPNFSKNSLEKLKERKNIIILESKKLIKNNLKEIKSVDGGYLEQDIDNIKLKNNKIKCVTKKIINKKIYKDLIFAYLVCKYVKSNAIVIAKSQQVLGIGAGQMSRLDSIKISLKKMQENFGNKKNYVVASDAFLPFEDNINVFKNKYCKAIIQPGGSKNDGAVIKAANKYGIAMYFTNTRHFKH